MFLNFLYQNVLSFEILVTYLLSMLKIESYFVLDLPVEEITDITAKSESVV